MDRETLLKSNTYQVEMASGEYWRNHGEKEGLDEAFEAGAKFQRELDKIKVRNLLDERLPQCLSSLINIVDTECGLQEYILHQFIKDIINDIN